MVYIMHNHCMYQASGTGCLWMILMIQSLYGINFLPACSYITVFGTVLWLIATFILIFQLLKNNPFKVEVTFAQPLYHQETIHHNLVQVNKEVLCSSTIIECIKFAYPLFPALNRKSTFLSKYTEKLFFLNL